MRDLVFVKYNSKLRIKRERKGRDPLEKEVNDVLADYENEFITGIVPSQDDLDNQSPHESQDAAPQEDSTSQAQAKRKRHAPVRPRRKKQKIRSLHSLMRDHSVQQSSSDSEDVHGDISMRSSDSDKSPCSSGSDE